MFSLNKLLLVNLNIFLSLISLQNNKFVLALTLLYT